MGIFSRLGTLIKSNINDLIAKAEDPEKMLNQVLLEMQQQLVEAKKQVAMAIADEKRIQKQFDAETEKSKDWERKAMLAVRAGDDALAKEALVRKQEHDGIATQYQQQWMAQKAAVDKGIAKQFPIVLTSGRLVEYEGGGEETRSNKWLAELQQDMFIEINPSDAAERGIKDGGWVWVTGAENASKARMKALVTERVGKGVAWCPFHFAGWFQGVDQRSKYPTGADPIVLGESVNALTTYGYDPVTGMQEPKATLCQIRAA